MSDHPWLKYRAQAKAEEANLHQTITDDVRVAQQAAEITRLRAELKWNIERDGDDLLICEGDHERHEGCTMQRWVKAENVATARREGIKEAAQSLIEKYQSMVIRPNTPEAWRFSILQDLRAMAGEKPNVITAADIDAAAIRAAAGDTRPSEEIIREDRDAWPDHQANDSIRAALEGGKKDD